MMLFLAYLIADLTTQPSGGIATWTASDWVLVIGAFGTLIAGIIASWRRADAAKTTAHEAKADAAEALGTLDAAQQSLTRLSNRQNAADVKLTDIALKTPVPPPGGAPPPALLLLPLLLIPFITGCANLSVPADWVKAERKTYDAIAPEYVDYVAADARLSATQKANRQNDVKSWESRIIEHEKVTAAKAGGQ
jgi:hypothetical protein